MGSLVLLPLHGAQLKRLRPAPDARDPSIEGMGERGRQLRLACDCYIGELREWRPFEDHSTRTPGESRGAACGDSDGLSHDDGATSCAKSAVDWVLRICMPC